MLSDYRIESNNNNEITVEMASETFARAFRSAQGALHVSLRLGKRLNEPLLSIAITTQSHTGGHVEVVQDVVIRILRASELDLISEPLCPTPDVGTNTDRSILCFRHLPNCACLSTR